MPPTYYGDINARNESLQGFVTGFNQSDDRFKNLMLAPAHQVPSLKGNFKTRDINQDMRLPDTAWDGINAMKSDSLHYSEVNYSLALDAIDVPQSEIQQPGDPPEDIEEASIRHGRKTLMLRQEVTSKTKFTTLGTFLSTQRTTVSAAADKWSAATSSPVRLAQTALAAITMLSETDYTQMSAPLAVWQALQIHPEITEMVKYTDGSKLSQMRFDMIAQALGFDSANVLDVSWDSSNKGGTSAPARLWPNDVIFQALDSSPQPGTSGHAVTLTMDQDLIIADSWNPMPWITTYYCWMAQLILITNSYAGYLAKTVI